MAKKRILKLFTLCVIVLSFIGCRDEICEYEYHPHEGRVFITLDKSLMQGNEEDVKLLFYDATVPKEDDNDPIVLFLEDGQQTIEMPEGLYNLIIYNDETETIMFSDMNNFYNFTASLDNISRVSHDKNFVSEGKDDDQVVTKITHVITGQETVGQPDMLYVYSVENFRVMGPEKNDEQEELTVKPKSVVLSLDIEVAVGGLDNVSQSRGVLSNVSKAIIMHSQEICFGPPVTAFCDINVNENNITTSVNIFGFHEPNIGGSDEGVKLHIDFLLLDGTVVSDGIEISEEMIEGLGTSGGDIELDLGITIPDVDPGDVPSGEGVFETEVQEWEDDVIIPITKTKTITKIKKTKLTY